MRYIVHVIDEASQHEKSPEDGQYYLVKGRSSSGEECDIARTDSWYLIDAKDSSDAVVRIANVIRVEGGDGKPVPLSDSFLDTQKKMANAEIGADDDSISLVDTKRKYSNQTRHDLLMGSCQIKKSKSIVLSEGEKNVEEEWYELHNVYFYVTKVDSIILVE